MRLVFIPCMRADRALVWAAQWRGAVIFGLCLDG